ncbi:MAG: RHS repeat protein, partial [Acidobacteria bacterium]|nr:RHS repeat protein [Acidobacteriota bacterium]
MAGKPREILEQRLELDGSKLHSSHVLIAHEVVMTSPRSYLVRQRHSLARTWETTPCGAGFCDLPQLSPLDPLTQQVHAVNEYDAFSQPLRERTVIENGDDDLLTIVERQISNDEDAWLLGLVTRETVTSYAAGDTSSQERLQVHDPDTGAVKVEILQPGDAQLFLQTTYARDAFGNVTVVETSDAGAHTRGGSITFDPRGVFPVQLTNALGHVTTIDWHEGLAVPQQIHAPDGTRTLFDYDGFSRPTGVRVMAGLFSRGDDATITYLPSPVGSLRVHSTVQGHGARILDHDRLGRAVALATLTADGHWRQTESHHDPLGNLIERTLPHLQGTPSEGADHWSHDIMGRPLTHEHPDGALEHWTHAGKLTTHVDEDGQLQRLRHDGAGRIVETIMAPGSPDEERLCLDYGPFSALTTVRPDCAAPGQDQLWIPGEAPPLIKHYEYDDLGRLVWSHDPGEGERHYKYSAFGEMIVSVDANDNFVSYEYDDLGRLILRSDDDGDTVWQWDTQAPGLLASASTETVTDGYVYDTFGRLKIARQMIDGEVWAFRHEYDAFNRPSRLHYPTHPNLPPVTIRSSYGQDGSLTAQTREGDPSPLWQVEQEDPAGHISQERFLNGLVTVRSHDPLRGHLLRLRTLPKQGAPLQDLRYQWTPGAALAERQDGRTAQLEQFFHDDVHRLIALTIDGPNQQQHERHFAYDGQGNLVHAAEIGDYEYGPDVASSKPATYPSSGTQTATCCSASPHS